MSTDPKRIGKYELQEWLGCGSMGEVWKALDTQSHRHVAIKLMRAELQNDSHFIMRFQYGTQVIAALSHPNIIKIFDVHTSLSPEADHAIYVVMDYIEGQNLGQYVHSAVRSGKFLSAAEIVHLFVPISIALDYAHHKGVVHRNLKPTNILLDRRFSNERQSLDSSNLIGNPILTDFSMAKLAGSTTDTLSACQFGRPHYCSPEQVKGLPGSKQSDLYSLGIILYEICTGVLPFNGDNSAAILTQHLNATPASPAQINTHIPPALSLVILRSIAKDPMERFPSATFMTRALCEALDMPIPEDLHRALQSSTVVDVRTELALRKPSQLMRTISAQVLQPLRTPFPDNRQSISPVASVPGVSSIVTSARHTSALSSSPLPTRSGEQSFKWREKRRYNALLIMLAVLALAGGFSWLLLFHQSTQLNTLGDLPGDIGVIKAPNGEYVGISDGTFAFDTQRPGGNLKSQAAEYLKAKDLGSAVSLWQQAAATDINDAETLIYMEDRRILDAGDPYITIVVGTTLTGDANSVAVGRENVQAAYVAQKEYNTAAKLPHGVKVRLLIANSGGIPTYATSVAQQIVQLAQKDKTIVAVMGWTFTAFTLNAIGVLSAAKIPMVTNSGADALTDRSSYFFRVTLPASYQGGIGAVYAEQSLRARTAAVFVDEKNSFVLSLANGFTNRFTGDGNTIVATENYTVGKSETLPALLQHALRKNPDVIYFAGYPGDAEGILSKLRPTDPIVLGGSSLYQLDGYSAEARKGLGHVRFTAYSYPDEWEILGLAAQKPAFFTNYKSYYDPDSLHLAAPYGYDRPDGTTMEMYDAISVLLYACSAALAEIFPITGSDLRQALAQVRGSKAFQGVTSQISFGSDGNPTDRAVVIICIDQGKFLKMDGIYGKFLVGEGKRAQISTPSVCTRD